MREEQFISFLEKDTNIESKIKAVRSRISKARKVEELFRVNLYEVLEDDHNTYELLKKIRETIDVNTQGSHGNAVRKYYQFTNQKNFPTLAQHAKKMKYGSII